MKVMELAESALEKLRPAWGSLLSRSAADTVFLTWEWATAWWAVYGSAGGLRILAAYDDDGTLRGLALLRSHSVRRYGHNAPAFSFLGDGSNDSDYLDFIVEAGYESTVVKSFGRYLEAELARGSILLLNEIPDSSPNLPFLRAQLEAKNTISIETTVACATLKLPPTWEEYLGWLRPRFRTKVRSILRRFEGYPEVRFGFCADPEHVRRMLPVLYDLHTRRWAQEGLPGVFRWERKREFYETLSPVLLQRDWLRFSWMEWGGQVLACQYGFAYGGKYFLLQEGYEPASAHWSPGIALRAWTIRECLREGLREYDFLAGVGRHKLEWGAEVKQSRRFEIAGASLGNALYCRGPQWEARAAAWVKRLVPQALLDQRRARIERQRSQALEANQPGESAGRSWTRDAAAALYFHSGMPALMRAFRDRYSLSVARERRWPRLELRRRTEPAARILYYHRINDDGDPFFPALSPRLFERQMRFVSRHYKVVSLAELLDRLQGGAPEGVLAITFDDGYQDNYLHAFPILQRYGLPATVFLTTGSIDSREPLWFEMLAQSIKRTPREFLDLEIDIPRRFWMRTEAERLDANAQIFGLLRRLPDAGRRQRLKEILRELGMKDYRERCDRMLTWSQIRLMKEHGVDFGGHTVSHPFISKLAPEDAAWELSECKHRIEDELQAPVDHFAYPNGRKEDIDRCKDLLRWAGYRAAVTTMWGLNYGSTDPMELRRGQPWEENPALFAYKLDWYQLTNG